MRLYTIEIEQTQMVAVQHQNGKLYPVSEFGMKFADMNDLIDCISDEQRIQLRKIVNSEAEVRKTRKIKV